MFVYRSMTKKVLTIGPDGDLLVANDMLKQYNIRHLPVVDRENHLLGIVTDRDLRSAMPSTVFHGKDIEAENKKLSQITVSRVMTPIDKMVTISPMDTIQDALLLIQRYKVGAIPVVDEEKKIKGIISVRDLLRAFVVSLGIGEPGSLIGILVENKVGQMKKIVDAITELGISFGSILVIKHWEEGKRAVFPYLLTTNLSQVKRKIKEIGFQLLDPMEWCIDASQICKQQDL